VVLRSTTSIRALLAQARAHTHTHAHARARARAHTCTSCVTSTRTRTHAHAHAHAHASPPPVPPTPRPAPPPAVPPSCCPPLMRHPSPPGALSCAARPQLRGWVVSAHAGRRASGPAACGPGEREGGPCHCLGGPRRVSTGGRDGSVACEASDPPRPLRGRRTPLATPGPGGARLAPFRFAAGGRLSMRRPLAELRRSARGAASPLRASRRLGRHLNVSSHLNAAGQSVGEGGQQHRDRAGAGGGGGGRRRRISESCGPERRPPAPSRWRPRPRLELLRPGPMSKPPPPHSTPTLTLREVPHRPCFFRSVGVWTEGSKLVCCSPRARGRSGIAPAGKGEGVSVTSSAPAPQDSESSPKLESLAAPVRRRATATAQAVRVGAGSGTRGLLF
jgi:hypothetical protein